MSIKSMSALVLSFVVVGCNAPTTAPLGMEATTAIITPDPVIGVNQHGLEVELGLLGVCPPVGDPYGDALFKGTITIECGGRTEVITLY